MVTMERLSTKQISLLGHLFCCLSAPQIQPPAKDSPKDWDYQATLRTLKSFGIIRASRALSLMEPPIQLPSPSTMLTNAKATHFFTGTICCLLLSIGLHLPMWAISTR